MPANTYQAVVMGLSAGGMDVLKTMLPQLPGDFPLPVAVVQHTGQSDSFLAEYLDQQSALTVKEAEDKEPLIPGTVYLAPGGYHLLIEPERIFGLSVDQRVNYSCPSIDVLFESAAQAYGAGLIGAVFTGANTDGSHGLKAIQERGGLTIVQDPESAQSPVMPRAALKALTPDYILTPQAIVRLLMDLCGLQKGKNHGTTPRA